MADLIDRHALIKEISKYHITSGITAQATWNECVDIIIETLESFPSAQPQRNKGKWIEKEYSPFYCSVCGTYQYSASWEIKNKEYNFCPSCGARMDGENDD